MKRLLLFMLILVFSHSCQYETDWKECRLMDSNSIEFSFEAGIGEIKVRPEINNDVRLYGLIGIDGELVRTGWAECSYNKESQIQSMVFQTAPWLTIKGFSETGREDVLNDFVLEVDSNPGGTLRTCRLVFVATDKKQTVTVTQHAE